MVSETELRATGVDLADEVDPFEYAYEQGWASDGLPIVPPTAERIRTMLTGTRRDPRDVVGRVPPKLGLATVEKVAINAVMAGGRPAYLPVILTALEALLAEPFNLNGVQATTHVAAPLVIVNGPIRHQIGLNSGSNVFGSGFRANATIGRAIRLILLNLGGGIPGELDKSQFGHPGKFSYCIAENEEAGPWTPLHVERGFQPADSTVTVMAAEAPHSVTNHVSDDAIGILTSVADTMATMGCNAAYVMGEPLVAIGQEHMQTIQGEGWTKEDVRYFLYQHARQPMGKLRHHGKYGGIYNKFWPKWLDRSDDNELVPICRRPDDILVIVAGGPVGRFSIVVPAWYEVGSRVVTRKIEEA